MVSADCKQTLRLLDAPGNDHYNLNGEYVMLRNTTSGSVAIGPADSVLVFTGSGSDDGSRVYRRFRRAVWNNDGDVAVLSDSQGRVVARYAY